MKIIDLMGKSIGRWHVLRYTTNGYWECRCTCGKMKNVSGSNLRRGHSTSCGCYLKEAVSKRRRNPRGPAGVVFNDYVRNAKKWNRVFEISFGMFEWLIQSRCHYCGAPPSNKCRPIHGNWRYNGLDRIDNKKGYTLDNVVAACGICNRMKDNISYKDFLAG